MNLFKAKQPDYEKLISILAKGDEIEILELLWQPKRGRISYLPFSVSAIQKLSTTDFPNGELTIHKRIRDGKFDLIIFNTPWRKEAVYYPLIIHRPTEKVVGIMLRFNELHSYFSDRENKSMGDLGVVWVTFILKLDLLVD